MKPKSIPNRPPMIKFFKNCLSTSLQIKGVRKIAIARLCKLLNCNASLLLKITKNIGPAITPYPTPIADCKKEAQKTIIPIIKNVSMLIYYKPSK